MAPLAEALSPELSRRARAVPRSALCSSNCVLRLSPTRPTSIPSGGQALAGIVGAQMQAELGPRGEHAIGFADAARHQIVDHHPEIGLGPRHAQGRSSERRQGRVGAGQQALRRRFLVAGGAVDLPGEEQAAPALVSSAWVRARGST